MKILKQLLVILILCLLGQVICLFLPFPFPASVAAMLLLLLLLATRAVKPEDLSQTADYLTGNMAFFFLPPGVGIMEYWGLLRGNVVLLLLICALATVLTIAATTGAVTLVRRLEVKRHG